MSATRANVKPRIVPHNYLCAAADGEDTTVNCLDELDRRGARKVASAYGLRAPNPNASYAPVTAG